MRVTVSTRRIYTVARRQKRLKTQVPHVATSGGASCPQSCFMRKQSEPFSLESTMSEASNRADASEKPAPPNWILQHPTYEQMKSLQVEDSEQVHAAFLVYVDLVEVRQWKEVSCVKSLELQVILLEGREKEGAPTQTILPLPSHRSLSHSSIRRVLDRGFPMLLCAVAADSTLIYQRMTDGLVTPDPPVGPFQDQGRRQHRKRRQKH